MQILVVTPKITTLGERFCTDLTFEWAVRGVLAEVIPQVTALAEDSMAALVLAAEVQLHTLASVVAHAHNIVPLIWDSVEGLEKACRR